MSGEELSPARLFEDDLCKMLLERLQVRVETDGNSILARLYDPTTNTFGQSETRVRISAGYTPLNVGGRTTHVADSVILTQEEY